MVYIRYDSPSFSRVTQLWPKTPICSKYELFTPTWLDHLTIKHGLLHCHLKKTHETSFNVLGYPALRFSPMASCCEKFIYMSGLTVSLYKFHEISWPGLTTPSTLSLQRTTSGRQHIGWKQLLHTFTKNKMQPTNPNAHTYVNGDDVETHGNAVMQILFWNSLFTQSCTFKV
jgi:hypothetical protein